MNEIDSPPLTQPSFSISKQIFRNVAAVSCPSARVRSVCHRPVVCWCCRHGCVNLYPSHISSTNNNTLWAAAQRSCYSSCRVLFHMLYQAKHGSNRGARARFTRFEPGTSSTQRKNRTTRPFDHDAKVGWQSDLQYPKKRIANRAVVVSFSSSSLCTLPAFVKWRDELPSLSRIPSPTYSFPACL